MYEWSRAGSFQISWNSLQLQKVEKIRTSLIKTHELAEVHKLIIEHEVELIVMFHAYKTESLQFAQRPFLLLEEQTLYLMRLLHNCSWKQDECWDEVL